VDYAKKGREQSEAAPFTFMYMGNVGPLAGIEVLFDAFADADLNDARLVIAGSGPAKASLERRAKNYSCNIEFWEVPTGMVPETQALADVLLLPVRKGYAKFSVPSKLAAYMFSAKPIIASVDNDSDTAECVEKSGAGWVVDPEDAKALSGCMKQAFQTSGDALYQKSEKGFDYAMRYFSKKQNIATLKYVCEEIINRN
jgi:glycosyltransferase involved in cell wall biosynthesis